MYSIRRALKSTEGFFERLAKARTLGVLRNMDRRWLEDYGYSVTALRHGIGAFPWRRTSAQRTEERRIRRAIAELGAYSDRELADLGISRSGIACAVRHGRDGFPCDQAADKDAA